MKVALTGAGGFLGQHILSQLFIQESALEVVAFTSKNAPKLYTNSRIDYRPRDAALLPNTLAGLDVLIHCAFPRSNRGVALARGLEYSLGVFQAAVQSKVGAIVNVSSQSVYSSTRETGATEDTTVSLESSYAIAKYSTELLLDACGAPSTATTSLRLSSLVGPHFDQRIVNKLIQQALARAELTVLKGPARYAFMDVRDASKAIVEAIEKRVWRQGKVLNVGAPEAYTLEDIATTVSEVVAHEVGVSVKVKLVEGEAHRTSSELDSSRFSGITGFHPSYDLRSTVQSIVRSSLHS